MSSENEFRKFDEFRRMTYENDDVEEIYNDDLSFYENIKSLCDRTLLLPYHDIQLPVLISYALMPSALATIAPIMFFCGGKGSGKSTAMQLIAAIHGQEVLSAISTGAAIRNHINKSRWYDSETLDGEKNTCLLFDNVSKLTFKNEFLYLLFLNGYNRKTDQVIMSKGDGENYVFRVFAPKIISSIHPLLNDPELDELQRRCMTLKFKNFDNMTEEERGGRTLNAFEMLTLETLNLSILAKKYQEFWDMANMNLYVHAKKEVKKFAKKVHKTLRLSAHRWTIALDLIATGLTFDVWDNPQEALTAIEFYWDWHDKAIGSVVSPLVAVLTDLIESETAKIIEINARHGSEVLEEEIQPNVVNEKIKIATQKGELDAIASLSVVSVTMNQLGWCLEKNAFKKMVWRRIK